MGEEIVTNDIINKIYKICVEELSRLVSDQISKEDRDLEFADILNRI